MQEKKWRDSPNHLPRLKSAGTRIRNAHPAEWPLARISILGCYPPSIVHPAASVGAFVSPVCTAASLQLDATIANLYIQDLYPYRLPEHFAIWTTRPNCILRTGTYPFRTGRAWESNWWTSGSARFFGDGLILPKLAYHELVPVPRTSLGIAGMSMRPASASRTRRPVFASKIEGGHRHGFKRAASCCTGSGLQESPTVQPRGFVPRLRRIAVWVLPVPQRISKLAVNCGSNVGTISGVGGVQGGSSGGVVSDKSRKAAPKAGVALRHRSAGLAA
jgi:hypothetical protein